MVLEADEGVGAAGPQEVPDEPLRARSGGHIEHPETGDRGAVLGQVLAPEELVAAADREHRRAALDRPTERVAGGSAKVGADEVLPLVLTATKEPQVRPVRVNGVAEGVRTNGDLDAAPARPLRQGEDVPAIAVDRHEIGIEVTDAQLHPPQSSQNCFT